MLYCQNATNISCSVALYLDSVSFNLFEKYSTGCQTFPCCCSKTAPTAVPDASDLTCTGNSRLYTLRTGADIKANFSASKAACYSAPNLNRLFALQDISKGCCNSSKPLNKLVIIICQTKKTL